MGDALIALMQVEPGTDAVVAWLEKLSQVGFGVLMALILFGHWMGIWVWGRDAAKQLAKAEAETAKEEAEKKEWKDMAMRMLAPLEDLSSTTTKLAKRG
jgi:hypothetical protein